MSLSARNASTACCCKFRPVATLYKGLLSYLNKSTVRGERYQKLEEPLTSYDLPDTA